MDESDELTDGAAAGRAPSSRDLGRLARRLAHDLGNLIHVIANIGEVLVLVEGLTEEDEELIEDLRLASDRVTVLVEQLRVAGRAATVALEPVDVGPLVVEAAALAETVGAVRVDIEVPDRPCRVLGDVPQLRRAFENLVQHAVDAMGEEGTLTACCRTAEPPPEAGLPPAPPAGYTEICFTDTGAAYPPEMQGRVLTLAELSGGSIFDGGIDLTVANLVAEAHGGRILVRPAFDHTATSFYLPTWSPVAAG